MQKSIATLLLGMGVFVASQHAEAQFFDKLKEKAEDAKKAAEALNNKDKKNQQSNTSSTQSNDSPSLEGGPSKELTKFTQCAGLTLENVTVGRLGNYEFQQGFSVEKRSGFIDRVPGTVSDGCFLPSIKSRQIIYMEVDTAKYKKMGSANDWEMQCVRSNAPGAGAVGSDEPKSEYPSKVSYLAPKDYLLHCGHDIANANECGEGSNSDRSGQWDQDLKSRGKTMLSVHGNTSTLAPPSGEKLYCQYYNKATRKSLFAFEYLRTRK